MREQASEAHLETAYASQHLRLEEPVMKYNIEQFGNTTVFRIDETEFTENTGSRDSCRRDLINQVMKNRSVVLDMSAIRYIDTASIVLLIEIRRIARKLGQDLVIAGVKLPTSLKSAMKSGVEKFIDVYANVETALIATTTPLQELILKVE